MSKLQPLPLFLKRLVFFPVPLCGAALVLSSAAVRLAGEDAPQPDADANGQSVIVTADRQALPLSQTTASVSVVTSADDHDSGYQPFVFDWLRDLPGVDVIQSGGGFAGDAEIRIRGTGTADTKILQDGIPVDDPTGISGNPIISLLNASALDHIEVVRGAQSGLYGSSAVGGVVNLISARPTSTPLEFMRLEGGSFGTIDGDALATGPINNWLGYVFGVNGMHSAGYSVQTDPGAQGNPAGHPDDAFDRIGFNGRIEAHDSSLNDRAYVAVNALSASQDNGTNGPDDNSSRQTVRNMRTSTGGTAQLAEHLNVGTDLAYTTIDRSYPNETTYDSTFDSREDYGSVHLSSDAIAHTTVMVGCDANDQSAYLSPMTGSADIDQSQHQVGMWGEVRMSWSPIELSGALRDDNYSSDGQATTYRLGAAGFLFDKQLKLFASTATGFRAPSLYERYAQYYGNPDLESQTSTSYEAGQTTQLGSEQLTLTNTWFRTEYHREITFDPNTYVSINLPSESHIIGVENSLRYAFEPVEFAATYTWQRSDDGTGTPLPLLPANKLSLSWVTRALGGWLRIAVDREWSRISGGTQEPPYTLLSAALGYDINHNWEVYVRADNLTNAHYEIYPLYTTEPRGIFAGVVASF